jgi:hypothetical protein
MLWACRFRHCCVSDAFDLHPRIYAQILVYRGLPEQMKISLKSFEAFSCHRIVCCLEWANLPDLCVCCREAAEAVKSQAKRHVILALLYTCARGQNTK